MVVEKGMCERGRKTEREEHRELICRIFPQSHWLGKQDGLDFVSSCNHQGLKPRVLKVSRLAGIKLGGHHAGPGKKADK